MDVTVKRTVIIVNDGHNEWNDSIVDRVKGLTGKAYRWSKYGGAGYGLIQKDKTVEWSCQACGEKQGSEMPSYMFEMIEGEFIRICTLCQSKKLMHHIEDMVELMELVRRQRAPWS